MDGVFEEEAINVDVNLSIGCQTLFGSPSLEKFSREQAMSNTTMDSTVSKLDVS